MRQSSVALAWAVADPGARITSNNAGYIMEQCIQSCRELLDRTLIWNQAHLLHTLHHYELHYNAHRPHRGIANTRPLHPLPARIDDPATIAHLTVRRHDRLGGILHEYKRAA
jgi:putative transposase